MNSAHNNWYGCEYVLAGECISSFHTLLLSQHIIPCWLSIQWRRSYRNRYDNSTRGCDNPHNRCSLSDVNDDGGWSYTLGNRWCKSVFFPVELCSDRAAQRCVNLFDPGWPRSCVLSWWQARTVRWWDLSSPSLALWIISLMSSFR